MPQAIDFGISYATYKNDDWGMVQMAFFYQLSW